MLTIDRVPDARSPNFPARGLMPVPTRQLETRSVNEALYVVRRHKLFIIGFVLAGVVLSAVVTYSLTPVYSANSTLVFERNDPRPYEAVVVMQNQERDKSAMETELDVIKSRVFLGIVVDALHLMKDPYFNPYLQNDSDTDQSDSVLGGGWSWLVKQISGTSEKTRIRTDSVQRDATITRLVNSVLADRRADSLAMTITVDHRYPAQAAEIANAISANYVTWTTSMKDAAGRSTITYLRGQAADIAASIANRERGIAAFAEKSKLAFDAKDDVLKARLEQLNQQFILARVDEESARAKVEKARQLVQDTGSELAGRVLTSDLLTSLRTEEARLQRVRAQLGSKYARNHPLVMDADAEIQSNRKMREEEIGRVINEMENDADVASARVKQFEQEVKLLQNEVQSRILAEIRRRELERDLMSEQKRYDQIVLRLGTLDPETEEVKATARIASYAEVPIQPSFPRPRLTIALGTIGSVFLAAAAVIIFEGLDSRLHSASQVEAITKRPNLVSIPMIGKRLGHRNGSPYHQMLGKPHSPFARAMRSLCLAWRSTGIGAGNKIVLFVSPSPGEGKTTCALGLAAVAATHGINSIILDLDPHKTGAGSMLGVPTSDLGLSKVLDGSQDLDSIIKTSPMNPNLKIISARLSLQDMDQLFQRLRDDFDLIIIDSPALKRDDDSVWLSSHVDSVVVVVAANRTHDKDLSDAMDRLVVNHAPVLGTIWNFADYHYSG
jgi:uncharacterized protein involved in exopolysaccharide biosynthesis/Mrp family chromosome partitioning ATPase